MDRGYRGIQKKGQSGCAWPRYIARGEAKPHEKVKRRTSLVHARSTRGRDKTREERKTGLGLGETSPMTCDFGHSQGEPGIEYVRTSLGVVFALRMETERVVM